MMENRSTRKPSAGERVVNAMKIVLCVAILLVMLSVGVYSLLDEDATVSEAEKRTLATCPEFSADALFGGSYIGELDNYYSDTFPFREELIGVNKILNRFYFYGGTDSGNGVLVMENQGNIAGGGERLDAEQSTKPTKPAPNDPTAYTETATPTEPTEPTEEEGFDNGVTDADVGASVGCVIIVGDRAMEIPTTLDAVVADYAAAVNSIQKALGDEVRVFSLVTPNAGEFYSPEDLHSGDHSQKSMIEQCYGQMNDKVHTVDAYSALLKHREEYVYFRTDHHWTALGAYYAYTAFCEEAGLEPVPLEDFETGAIEGFVGSLYNATSAYPQSDALKNNPDTVNFYRPVVDTSLTCYSDATLSDPQTWMGVINKISEEVSNKYLCFLGGDNPIAIIDTDVDNGKVCMVLKESYGNAFTPFLTSHYSRVIAIDPREFNRDDLPSLDLAAFAEQMQVDDVIVLNYPLAVNNSAYVDWLERLVK